MSPRLLRSRSATYLRSSAVSKEVSSELPSLACAKLELHVWMVLIETLITPVLLPVLTADHSCLCRLTLGIDCICSIASFD